AGEIGAGEVRAIEAGAEEIGIDETRILKIRAREVAIDELAFGKIQVANVEARQVAILQMHAPAIGLAQEKALVKLRDLADEVLGNSHLLDDLARRARGNRLKRRQDTTLWRNVGHCGGTQKATDYIQTCMRHQSLKRG